ncbi:MAG: hypothetical protein JWP00_3414 [Chloroflexi bacterium]|jgi:hypothetical protein|nr:hypothetical protein [Chloroflexota bacterium]
MYRNQMVDNNTYNILQAYVSTLEALEVYQKYSQDGNEQLWKQVAQHTEQIARILQQQLPQALQNVQGSMGATASQSGSMGSMDTSSQSGNMGTSSQSSH